MEYAWLSNRPLPPPEWDLRDHGWRLDCDTGKQADRKKNDWSRVWKGLRKSVSSASALLIDMRPHSRPPLPQNPSIRRRALLLGVERSSERARWIEAGYGDAMAMRISKAELSSRLSRILLHHESLPKTRTLGALKLDIFHRDAMYEGRWLALHPREFAVLWRLADAKGQSISRGGLLADVWRLQCDPGTNRVEVHISRLRQKLTTAGCDGLIITDPSGGYRLATSD